MITGQGDVLTVEAMKAGAADFIEKPIGRDEDELVDRPRTQLKAGHLSFLRGFGDQVLRRIIITSTKLGTGPRTIPSKILHPLLGARARLTGRRGEHTPTATAN
jgi:hypothetical protein